MPAVYIVAIIASAILAVIVVLWILTSRKKETEIRALREDCIRKDAEIRTAEALRQSEKDQQEKALSELKAGHDKALANLKESQQKAIEAAKTALALENEKGKTPKL